MLQFHINSKATFLYSFTISIPFSNNPLTEPIQIFADNFYNSELLHYSITKPLFTKFPTAASTSIKFSFSNTMYKQINGVALSTQLGPALANKFVGFYQKKLFRRFILYFPYINVPLLSSTRNPTATVF